tara:strand:+ start:318 stop:539 length:222 start_codon:yes stop_codon:yes gene_type:complete
MWLYDINKDYSKYTKKLVMIIADTDKIYRGHLLNIYPPVCFDDPEKYQATIQNIYYEQNESRYNKRNILFYYT